MHNIQECKRCEAALISLIKVVQVDNFVVLDEKGPHIRNNRDGTVISLDVNNRAYTMDVCVSRRNWSSFQLAGTMSGSSVTHTLVRPRTKCSSQGEESYAEQGLKGVEGGEDAMTDEEGEGAAGTTDWRVRAGPRNKPTAREREEHEATHMPFRDWCTHCMMGRGRSQHHRVEEKRVRTCRGDQQS